MFEEHFTIDAPLEHTIAATAWGNSEEPRAVIQIFHGLGEHRARYARFAAFAAEREFAVVCHDHRGHGAEAEELGFFAPQDGWNHVIEDGRLVNDAIKKRFPGAPIVLLGHSMGSYIAQAFAMRHHEHIATLILSASTWPEPSKIIPGRMLARLLGSVLGRRGKSDLLTKLSFGNFNRAFEPTRTEFDWLSRDEDEVDAYVADPLCGGSYSRGLWVDLLGGLSAIGNDRALEKIPSDLPILLTAGDVDPVGGAKGVGLLARHYANTGHHHLGVRLYEDGRHEMLNEINRDEFSDNVIRWIENQLLTLTSQS